MATRPLTFIPKMQVQKKESLLAVAWITATKGGYEGSNVTQTVARDLAAAGYRIHQDRVHDAFVWLDEHGYAIRSVLGKRHVMFVMDPEVTFDLPAFVKARRAREASALEREAEATVTHLTPPPVPPLPGVPLPEPRPAWLAPLEDAILTWHSQDPARAEEWAAAAQKALDIANGQHSAGSVGA